MEVLDLTLCPKKTALEVEHEAVRRCGRHRGGVSVDHSSTSRLQVVAHRGSSLGTRTRVSLIKTRVSRQTLLGDVRTARDR